MKRATILRRFVPQRECTVLKKAKRSLKTRGLVKLTSARDKTSKNKFKAKKLNSFELLLNCTENVLKEVVLFSVFLLP